MRTIVILISHDHYRTISQRQEIVSGMILLSHLKAHDLDQVLYLIIVIDLFDTDVSHIQKLSLEREHTILITTNNLNSAHGQTLGRVSLCQNQCALQ
jgi:hypothetical protein